MEDLDRYINRKLKELKRNKNKELKDELRNNKKEKPNMKSHTNEYKLWANAKYRSIAKNIPFDIEISDIVIPEKCPYLDVYFTKPDGSGSKTRYSPSIDKIIPELGYVRGNIQVISWLANTMKNRATIEELNTFSKNVLKLHGEKEYS